MKKTARKLQARRTDRIRRRVRRRANGKPRLSVFRSARHIYAQVIDDSAGCTLAAVSSLESSLREAASKAANMEMAARVGQAIAERAAAAGVSEVVFDRGGYRYHGRVKALAEAAREGGLKF